MEIPVKRFFFKGGVWTGPPPKRAKVKTRVLYEGDLATPEMWAVRYEHADGDVKSRSWTTNIAITQGEPARVALRHRSDAPP